MQISVVQTLHKVENKISVKVSIMQILKLSGIAFNYGL